MKILEEIGLTKTEARIYEHLLRLGESPVSSLQKSLDTHPQIIYRTIDNLTKKDLVTVVNKKNKKFVIPEHPKKLEELEKEKLNKLKNSLPELIDIMNKTESTLVKTSVGFEAIRSFRRMAINELKRSETLYIIGGSGDRFYDVMGDDYEEIENKRIKKKINKKLLAFSQEKEKFNQDTNRLHTDFRYFSSNHPTLSSINIFNDHVGIIIWSTEPILIHINSHEVANSYKHYFNELWLNSTN
ncbi:MAG: helix-turn-helix domain-containing protein [Candidatus Paceibacterota bacterium]